MHYDFVAIPDEDVPVASEPAFQHLVTTYAGETNKTVGVWRTVPDDLLNFRPHEKTNTIRAILAHQILHGALRVGRSLCQNRQVAAGLTAGTSAPTIGACPAPTGLSSGERLGPSASDPPSNGPSRRSECEP